MLGQDNLIGTGVFELSKCAPATLKLPALVEVQCSAVVVQYILRPFILSLHTHTTPNDCMQLQEWSIDMQLECC
jgi:hypothetical protein